MTEPFGRWLRRQLERRQWSMTTFASKIGVSHSSVSLWLDGKRVPSPKSCDRIADVLMVDVDQVLALAGHRPPDIEIDPDSATARLMPLIEQINWNARPGRLEGLEFELRQMIEWDRMVKEEQ